MSMQISAARVGYLKMSPYPNNTEGNNERLLHENIMSSPQLKSSGKPMTKIASQGAKKVKAQPICRKTSRKKRKIKTEQKEKVTNYFSPVRRSSRKTKSALKKENENKLINAILNNQEDGLEVVELEDKGRGVITTRNFSRGEFVVEYAGDLIYQTAAKEREILYTHDSRIGCYMYYFNAKGQNYCVDATAESGRLGRLLNHSRKNPNCCTRMVWLPASKDGPEEPRIIITAKRDIVKGEELLYDYGDRDKSSLEVHPWLNS